MSPPGWRVFPPLHTARQASPCLCPASPGCPTRTWIALLLLLNPFHLLPYLEEIRLPFFSGVEELFAILSKTWAPLAIPLSFIACAVYLLTPMSFLSEATLQDFSAKKKRSRLFPQGKGARGRSENYLTRLIMRSIVRKVFEQSRWALFASSFASWTLWHCPDFT